MAALVCSSVVKADENWNMKVKKMGGQHYCTFYANILISN
jgi:hypothetical protein